ncbi:FMN-dependent NADH-azoreductase [Desulfovibrio ferrophilus]|uniref:FMN dependent NADH:quinone oxidoreductase n=1 Tax=Desulfovibrio ferrophilus TaxID=241368 RepID=A0A2Z6AVL8_9BACT|nr:NAD(P)H-dependent oxidoreductase [Desulfovibrio ferrophilus]BBD07284.1 FMN-dependent NADH-azoreductase [Desulfovibrio ferrophilus]
MSRLLYIKASPREERSHSIAVADAFSEAWKEANAGGEVVIKNIFEEDLPPFDGFRVQAKYNIMHGKEHSAEQKQAWEEIEKLIAEFKSFDRFVFAVPMWNFSIPYRLKQYIDLIVQPGYTFGMNETGYFGMVEGAKALTVYASGGEYQEGNPLETFNFQSTYLRSVLGFMGITDVIEIEPRGTLMDSREANREQALGEAREIAKTF